jgi:hypothetical protein
MRCKGEEERKTLWINLSAEWKSINGYVIPTDARVIWLDEGNPWAIFNTEDVVYNVEVEESIRNRGK